MRARGWVAMAAALALAACGGGADDGAAGSAQPYLDEPGEETIASYPDEGAANGPPAAWLEELQQGAPEDVARLLLQWDTAGLRFEGPYADALMALYCYQPEQQCRSDEPAWDFVLVVDGYTLDPVLETPDSAQYVITFDEVGAVWPDRTSEPIGSPPETLSLKRMDGRWRVVGLESQMPPHLSRSALLRTYRGVQPDSSVIANWLEERQ